MPIMDYLAGSIYHMVRFDNLQSIFQRRALLSKERVIQETINYQSIAYEEVQNLRDRIFIWDSSKKEFRSLHCYVPFYFATLTPMLYVQHKKGIQNEIVLFEVSRSILNDQGVLFTDGNASNQQLAKYANEVVEIIPATIARDTCRRRYHPNGPNGANPNRTDFFSDVAFLERLKWEVINDRWSQDFDKIRIRHAEVLIPDILPLGRIQGISVKTQNMAQVVNALIVECGLEGRIPSAVHRPNLYIQ